jgi:hypothetical protein
VKTPTLVPSLCCAFAAFAFSTSIQAGTAPIETSPPPIVQERDVIADALAPELSLRYDYDFPMSLDGAPGEYSMQEFRASVPLPPVITDTFILISSLNYRLFEADVDTSVLNGDLDLHTLRLPITAACLSPTTPWLGIVYVEPGLSTDFSVVNDNSFDLSAGVGVGYRFSDNLMIALGVGYSRNYGDDDIFPALAVLWRPNEHFMFTASPDGIVPEWRPNDDWRVKLKLDFLGGRWTVEDPEGRGRDRDRIMRLEGATVSLLVERRLFDQCWLTLGAGFNTLANLRIEDSDESLLLDEDLEDAFVLRSGLKWKF